MYNTSKTLTIPLLLLFISACTPSSPFQSDSKPLNGDTDLYKITTDLDSLPDNEKNWIRPTDCRANIKRALCEVYPLDPWTDPLNRKCLGGEEEFLSKFEEIYDSLDQIHQTMFCSLRRIYIERRINTTAYASNIFHITEDGTQHVLPGAILGVRKDLLESENNYARWATWKEQKNFFKDTKLNEPEAYPFYESQTGVPLLPYVIVHEFAHLFDFANHLNAEETDDKSCAEEYKNDEYEYRKQCNPYMKANTWGAISWKNTKNILAEKDFPERNKLCFYGCLSYMKSDEMISMYKGLAQSDFISSYASSNNMEDFAESWATRWLISSGKDLSLIVSPDFKINLQDIYNSDKFHAKREFMDKFAAGKIMYP